MTLPGYVQAHSFASCATHLFLRSVTCLYSTTKNKCSTANKAVHGRTFSGRSHTRSFSFWHRILIRTRTVLGVRGVREQKVLRTRWSQTRVSPSHIITSRGLGVSEWRQQSLFELCFASQHATFQVLGAKNVSNPGWVTKKLNPVSCMAACSGPENTESHFAGELVRHLEQANQDVSRHPAFQKVSPLYQQNLLGGRLISEDPLEGCDGANYQTLPPGRSNKLYF